MSILLVKNPAGANEVLRTLTLEDGAARPLARAERRIADGRDVSWIWDADFELLAGRVRRVTCSGTRAEEMALRLKYAGIDAELGGGARPRPLARRAPWPARDGRRALYALPTYTALLELRDLLAERGLGEAVVRVTADAAVWHDVECALLRRPTCRSGASWPTQRTGRSSTSAAAPAASRSTWRRAATT